MSTESAAVGFNFTVSFQTTIRRYEELSAGKKADYERAQQKAHRQTALIVTSSEEDQ